MRRFVSMIPLVCCAMALGFPAQAAPPADPVGADGLRDSQVADFVAAAKAALRSDSTAKVVDLMSFPFLYDCGGLVMRMDKSSVLALGAGAVPSEVREAIMKQEPSAMLRNWKGAMFGDGQAWMDGICVDGACVEARPRLVMFNACPRQ